MREPSNTAILTRGGAEAYRKRVVALAERVDAMGWGARARVARGVGAAASTISNVLNGTVVSNMQLDRIEKFMEENEEAYDG